MGIFTIDYGNKGPLLVDAYCFRFHYQDTIDGAPNPESQADFTKRMLLKTIKDTVRIYKKSTAVESAAASAETEAEADTALITVD